MNQTCEEDSPKKLRKIAEILKHKPTPWVMLITFSGMCLSLIFHILIPWQLDVSESADALIAALKVVLIVDIVFREGAKFSLVPLFISEEKARDKVDFQRFTSGIINFSLCVGVGLMVLLTTLSTLIAELLLSSRTVLAQTEMATLLRWSAPLVIFGSGSTILGAFLNSQKHFKTVAFRNTLPPLLAIIALLYWTNTGQLVYSVSIAYAGGFFVYFVWLCFGMYRTGYRYRFSWISFDALRSLKDAISLPTIGFAIRQLTARIIVEILLVGRLGKGAITLYNSAFRVFSAIQSLIGISIATTGLPEMTTDSIEKDLKKLKQTLLRKLRWVIYIAIPLFIILLFSASRIAQLLFSGEKFNPMAVEQIGKLLMWLSLGTVFSCMIPVLNAGLYAQKEYGLVFRNMVTMAVLNLLIALVLLSVWGLNGIALTISITAFLAAGNLVFLLSKTGVFFVRGTYSGNTGQR